ncbi:MAG: nucleotide-binding protein [Microbacterium gubbeenense]|uniref:MinD/ParA family ATP-binding protein n=1 Tax=Microbacterium gubbeenense TaxID=159896 RepID=UPI003F9C7FBF
MAIDRTPSHDDENEELGVLDEPGTSTTAIDLGMTAQVSVVLPAGYQDDDRDDDDVIADEFDHWTEESAEVEDDVIEDDSDAESDDRDDSASEVDDAPILDETDADARIDGSDDDVIDVDADTDDETRDIVDASDIDEDESDEDDDIDASDIAASDIDEDGAEDVSALDEADLEDESDFEDEPDLADDAALDEPSGEADPEPSADDAADPAPAAPNEPHPAATVDTQPDTVQENIIVREPEPMPAAASAGAANRVSTPARPGRESFVRQPIGDACRDPESSDVLTDERLLDTGAIRKPEPEDPWRRIIYAATRGLINLGDGKKTRARKALMARIAAPIPGRVRFVPVMSRKGGVGKTTVTALLGMALADARDDRVVAIDANPDRGTLAERISKPSGKTVRDLVRSHAEITGYADMTAHVTRDATRLDVLASDADPHVADAFSDQNYRDVAEIAQHYYSLVLTDTGTGIIHSVMDATLDLGDQVVIVSGISVDEARLAAETLTWLETNGREELAKNAVVVINQDRPGTPLVRLDELETHFRSRVRDVVRIPYDAGIATGSAISFHDLDRTTRDAARRLAASVVEGIRAS